MAENIKVEWKHQYVIHTLIMFGITFGFRLIPPPGTVTEYGMAILGIFFGLVYGWTFLGLLYPSLFGAIALTTTGYGNATAVFVAMFSNSTVLMMILGVLAFAAVQYTGAGDWLIGKLLSSKWAQKSPVMIVEVFLLCWMIGFVIGIAWFLIFGVLALISQTLVKCGYEKGDRFCFFVLAGCIIAGQIGQSFLPFMGWGIMITGTAMQATQTAISYNAWMLLDILVAAVFLVTYPLLMKLFKCDFSKLATVDIAKAFPVKNSGLDLVQKLSIYSIVLFILLVAGLNFLSSKITVFAWLNTNWGVLGFMAVLWLFVIALKIDDKPILDMKKAAAGFSWDMLMLIAVALLISSVLTSAETGISNWIASIMMPLFSNNVILFIVILAAVTMVLTNLCNNIAICFVMLNLVSVMYLNGFAIHLAVATLTISLSSTIIAFLTPASSINGALLHADPSLKSSTVYKFTPVLMIYGILLLMAVMLPYSLLA